MEGPIRTAAEDFVPLTDEEVQAFVDDLDKDKDGYVVFDELEAKLEQVHKELAPEPKAHHLLHPKRRDLEKREDHSGDGLHAFLCSLLPECESRMSREDFVQRVHSWRVPSQKQTDQKEQNHEDEKAERKLPAARRLRAKWAVHGPTYCFMAFVVLFIAGIGTWQMVIYIQNGAARAALGWGVIVAKASAGCLYPTLLFMLLSMSRHLGTFLRREYYLAKVINWDISQAFHVKMSIAGLFFASLHAIGHLTGSFIFGSRSLEQPAIAQYLGPTGEPRTYVSYVRSLPGITGIVSLGLFWIISLLSMPFLRKRFFELFQAGHLLMFPMIGLLCAHGTVGLLQPPMLGYWLAFPALVVIMERSWRIIRGFMPIPSVAEVLDNDTVRITCKHPRGKEWRYSAGQYVLVQIPKLSFWQWHPFTISGCRGDSFSVHIKVDGNWTEALRDYVLKNGEDIRVGIDGPFGAPAQRFYDFDYSIIVGGGIGITPFSAILTDIEEAYSGRTDPWERRRNSRSMSRPRSGRSSRATSRKRTSDEIGKEESRGSDITKKHSNPERRVDFHWTVREKNDLLWFSDLLNRAIVGAKPLEENGNLDLNINTHITAKRKNISTHIFRYLLDSYRTDAAPYSALTGLKQPSHFGRPDFDAILERHYQDLIDGGVNNKKVGVFYCGAPVVGEILADRCHELTKRARADGLRINYHFLMEVFE